MPWPAPGSFCAEITGDYIEELASPRDPLPLLQPEPADENAWVETALDQNLNLIANRIAKEIARDEIRIRRSGHFPSIDLVASRLDIDSESDRSNDGGPFLPAPFEQTQDTIQLQFVVPLFTGGLTSSRVREAVYQHRAAQEALERVARQTERETRDAYLGVISEISRVQALRQAVESSETALQATEAGFDVGTRTTVDVLDARRRLLLARPTTSAAAMTICSTSCASRRPAAWWLWKTWNRWTAGWSSLLRLIANAPDQRAGRAPFTEFQHADLTAVILDGAGTGDLVRPIVTAFHQHVGQQSLDQSRWRVF